MKTYHFLSGFPRSGGTLLAALLNQNPEIYASPLSPIVSMLWDYNKTIKEEESVKRLENKEPITNVGKGIIVNYYQNINKPIIFDREKAWATTGNLEMIKKYITPTPKIIVTVRPVLEILSSWISLLTETSFIDIEMKESGWWYKDYLTKNDNRCDYIMRPSGQMDRMLFSINEIIKPENKNAICLIKYDDLINMPQETMDKIYNFLELPTHKHNFNKIKKLEKDNDEVLGHPTNIHEVRPQLKKISKDPKEVLSEYVINKYSNIGWEAK